MNQKKFCCKKFEGLYMLSNSTIPNIRIMKYILKENSNSVLSMGKYKIPYRFYITVGYEKIHTDLPFAIFIEYCPFCGKDLYKYYKDDSYVNEIEGETFVLP